MKKFFVTVTILCSLAAFGQPMKSDSLEQIRDWAKWYDLDFTVAEADSMLGDVVDFSMAYKKMHSRLPENSIPYPFAFHPAPYGLAIPQNQKKVTWTLPQATVIPVNKNELAFYSIPQLASLIKNRKISSVELTMFFLDRLKKWGDTLECVVNLTEELALQQARQADSELKQGIYKGPLHGIPYGLKDLFSVKGYKTTWGSAPYKEQTIDEDAYVYVKLKEAGAVLCAKLSLGSLA